MKKRELHTKLHLQKSHIASFVAEKAKGGNGDTRTTKCLSIDCTTGAMTNGQFTCVPTICFTNITC